MIVASVQDFKELLETLPEGTEIADVSVMIEDSWLGIHSGKLMLKPIDMIIFCPACGKQHVDAPEPHNNWTNPPHKSHYCKYCSKIFRLADVPTNGVASIKTIGVHDTWDIKS